MSRLDTGFNCSMCGERLSPTSAAAHTCAPMPPSSNSDQAVVITQGHVPGEGWVKRAVLDRLLSALSRCEGYRGAFSRHSPHDLACRKWESGGMVKHGPILCGCGRDELDAAVKEAREAREA